MIFAGTTNNNITNCLGFVKEMIASGRMCVPNGLPQTKESNLAGCCDTSLEK